MKREPLPLPIDQDDVLVSILRVLECIDATLSRHLLEPAAEPVNPLLAAIIAFTSALATFSAGELLETADAPLCAAIDGRDAHTLGRELSDLDGTVALGRRGSTKRALPGPTWSPGKLFFLVHGGTLKIQHPVGEEVVGLRLVGVTADGPDLHQNQRAISNPM
jgi:hypothetical protein